MKKIFILVDYKNRFNLKHNAIPYRSGMNIDVLKNIFIKNSFNVEILNFSEIDYDKNKYKDKYVIYSSQEDIDSLYKSYIEDIIYGLELLGAHVIPSFKMLRAHNNKVFMEILRKQMPIKFNKNIVSLQFGCLEELYSHINDITFPSVIKSSSGANSKNVELAKSRKELFTNSKKLSRSKYYFKELWEIVRKIKHKGYIKESKYRNKFIIQSYIKNLENDWKIYVFYDKYFIFYRPILEGRVFKASGGGYNNYLYGSKAKIPNGLFEYVEKIFNYLDIPTLSIDIAFDGEQFYMIEMQAIHFGTAGVQKEYSKEYFTKKNGEWVIKENNETLESLYSQSIVNYILEKYY